MTIRLGRSLLGSAGLRIANAGLGFAVAVVLARTLGADGYGLYSTAFVIASVCAIVVQFGMPNLVMRETATAAVSEDWEHMRAVWRWAGRGAAVFSLAVLAIGALVLFVLRDGMGTEQLWTYALALGLVPLLAFGALRAGALRGLQHVVLAQVPEMIVKPGVMLALALMLGLAVPAKPSSAMAMQLAAVGLAFALGAVFLWQRRPFQLRGMKTWESVATGPLWKAALTMALAAGMNQINNYADILMIGLFWPAEEVGLYRVAYQISMLCAFGLQITSVVFSPTYAQLYRQGNVQKLQILLTRSALFSTGIALLLALPWLFSGRLLTTWLFGPDFAASWAPTMILVVAQIMNASFGPIGMLMNMTGFERYVARFMTVAGATNLCLNFLLIPFYGAWGAATATFVTLAIWNVGLWWMTRRHLLLNSHVLAAIKVVKR